MPSSSHNLPRTEPGLRPADDRPTVITRGSVAIPGLVPGRRLGPFELVEPIGRGGMATVFKAIDRELGRTVALKILPPEMVHDADTIARFKQEARAAALLDHDNIARIHSSGDDDGLHYIAFEFVPGDNLRTVIDTHGPLPAEKAFDALIQIARGLEHASARGVTHRDIKPSNIIITPEGTAKIVDMGLARSGDANGGVTQSGVTLGTFDYISPEQAMDPRRADVRSDIYSLGCTFYHAVTGRPPVPDGTAARKLQAHQKDKPIDPRDIVPGVPEAMVHVLARMMAKEPERRPADAAELLKELQAAASGQAPASELVQRPLSLPWLLAACAAAVVAAIVLGQGRSKAPDAPPWNDVRRKPALPEPAANTAGVEISSNAVSTVQQLAESLKVGEALTVRLMPGTIYDLTTLEKALVFPGSQLTIEPEPGPGTPPILKLAAADASMPGTLRLPNLRKLKLRGLDLRIVEPVNEIAPAAFAIANAERVELLNCIIRRDGADTARIAFDIAGDSAELSVKSCLWNLGWESQALRLAGVKAEIEDCAFGPHNVAIAVVPGRTAQAAEIKFVDCSFMMGDVGAVVRAETVVSIEAGGCLFAKTYKPDAVSLPAAMAFLVDEESKLKFIAMPRIPNAFYAAIPSSASENNYRVLTDFPWANADPRLLLGGSDPVAAFRLSLADPRLRYGGGTSMIGAKHLGPGDGRLYGGEWPPARPPVLAAGKGERIVWPDAEPDDAAIRVYSTLAAAFAAAMPDDTILIAVNGPLPVPVLPERSLKLTLRAADGYKPILVPEGLGYTVDAAMFRLTDGSLAFENLEIDLKNRQAVAVVPGRAACIFRHCIVTLHGRDDAPAAAAAIPDGGREMKAPGTDEPPRVLFENTIIRGTGRAVWLQAARAANLSFENCAAALDGSLVVLEAGERTPSELPKVALKLTRSTLFLSDAAVELQGSRGQPPATATVEAIACLFAPLDPRSSASVLVLLSEIDPLAELAKSIDWSGRDSAYAYPDSAAIEWRIGAQSPTWDWPRWQRYARDDGQTAGRLKLMRGSVKSKMTSIEAADFTLAPGTVIEAGADLTKLPQTGK